MQMNGGIRHILTLSKNIFCMLGLKTILTLLFNGMELMHPQSGGHSPEMECQTHICETIPDGNIIIRANDTDALNILLTHAHTLPTWYDCGLNSNNSRRYEDISLLARNTGQNLCMAISGFHAFTGSEYTALFLNKGKVRPLALMEKSVKFMTTFGKLGESSSVAPETVEELETYRLLE